MMSEDFLAAVSPKSRPKFYFEKERPSFHTAWTQTRHALWGFAEIWNIAEASSDHSAVMPANLTTLAHFAVSSATSLPKSAGEPGSTVAPNPMPYQELSSKPGTKSLTIGMSGNWSERVMVDTANGRSSPAPDVLDRGGHGAEHHLHLSAQQVH